MKKILKISITAIFILTSTLFFGQNHEINGTITSEKGTPLDHATISIKGTKINVASDNLGKFLITTTTNTPILVVSLFVSSFS